MEKTNSNINLNKLDSKINIVNIQKMVFIYNALLTGWNVKYLGDDKFEFTKPKSKMKRFELNLKDYLKKFVDFNLNIENLN